MDNKLSELSKPVAWTSARSLDVRRKVTAFTDVESAAEYASANCWEKIAPLYSQEYVSALIQRAERLDSMLTESVQALKAAEQRIAELSRLLSHNIERAEEAEKRLATPVRLPTQENYDDPLSAHLAINDSAEAIRTAGFKVEGDEQDG